MDNQSSERIICYHEETIHVPAETLFPLACPVEELKWIDGWTFDMIYSESGMNENNCIFIEKMSYPFLFGSPGKTIWHTTLYDPKDSRVHFLLICERKALIKWEISFETMENGKTKNRIHATLTSISRETDRIGKEVLEQRLSGIITFLGQALKHYSEQGEILTATTTDH